MVYISLPKLCQVNSRKQELPALPFLHRSHSKHFTQYPSSPCVQQQCTWLTISWCTNHKFSKEIQSIFYNILDLMALLFYTIENGMNTK